MVFKWSLAPEYSDQLLPLAKLGKQLQPDYLIIKHCSDNEDGVLGVDYSGYEKFMDYLSKQNHTQIKISKVKVKWSKIKSGENRSYNRCYGALSRFKFLVQV